MNHIHAIALKGVGPFENVVFNIPKGISVIYGLNRAGGKASKNSNAVGKSLLTSQPAEIIYDEPIVGEKADKLKMGTRALSYTNTYGHKVVVNRSMRGRAEKIAIKVNGKDKKFRTPTIARQYLKKSFPISQEEYNTYVHIDSRVPHPLVMGSSAERKRFFTAFFGLNKMDMERKLFAAELSKLGKIKAGFSELRVQYNKSKEDLIEDELYASMRKKARSYKLQLTQMQEEFQDVQETLRLIQYAESASEQIATLQKAMGGPITTEEFERAVKDNTWELDKIKADLEDAEEWERYKRDNANYIEAAEKLSVRTKRAVKEYGMAEARSTATAKAKESRRLKSAIGELKADRDTTDEELKGFDVEKVAMPEGDREDVLTALRAYNHQLEHAEQFAEGKCETCGQVVQIKDPKTLRLRVKKLAEQAKQHRAYAEYKSARKQQQKLIAELSDFDTQIANLTAELKAVQGWEAIDEELQDLPRKPKKFEGKKLQVVVLKRMLEELYERRSLLEYMRPHLETIIEFQKLTKEQIKKARATNDLSGRMNTVQERLSKIQAKLEVHQTVKGRVLDMRTRLVEMKRDLHDEEPLRLLVQGYQDKNIKKMAVEAISQRLMALVNQYAGSVFPESYRFEFEWGTQVSMIVHRKYGKKVLTSDVRKLSGAESKLFTIVLVLALLAFVPSHKRCSMMILDEPSANLSKEMTQAFQDLLPILNTVIPSIIVVTPKSDEIYEGATPFTVVKSSGVATIVEGFPHQVK